MLVSNTATIMTTTMTITKMTTMLRAIRQSTATTTKITTKRTIMGTRIMSNSTEGTTIASITTNTNTPTRNKQQTVAQRRAAAADYFGSLGRNTTKTTTTTTSNNQATKESQQKQQEEQKLITLQELQEERHQLMSEASFLARVLYRLCFRSVQLLRPGNEHDHREFDQREEEQYQQQQQSGLSDKFFSAAPPVDRENELKSRYDYYYSFLRENFEQDGTCLDRTPYWLERDVQMYFQFIQKGQKSRIFILKQYQFDDPYHNNNNNNRAFDNKRLEHLEHRMDAYMKKLFQVHGWKHSSEDDNDEEVDEYMDDDDFDDDFDDAPWK